MSKPQLASFWLTSAAVFLAPALALANKPTFNICYISLNKGDEYHVTKDFMEKLNKQSEVNIQVFEFQPDKRELEKKNLAQAAPNNVFRKMIEGGTKCDGLVISGHHTGSWGGHRGNGRLSMDYLETLSCNPKYADFFRNINAVWLQGCRTLGVGQIAADQANNQNFDADHHTNRVGAVLEEDGLNQNFAELNTEFTNTLDQDNPLSSRYLRIFPSAKLFGWTETAPGEKANSQYSVLFHIAHMARVMDQQDQFPAQSPRAPNLTPESVAKYVDATLLALSHFGKGEERCEQLAVDAWIAHGTKAKHKQYSYDNDDLNALTPLNSSGNELLQLVKDLECKLKAASAKNDTAGLNAVLNVIETRPELIPYSFNNLVEMRNSLIKAAAKETKADVKAKKNEMAKTILERMKKHPTVLAFLTTKIRSKQVGVLRKVDYYHFYRNLTGKNEPDVETEIQSKVLEELKKPLPRTTQSSRNLARDYRRTLLESLLKNKLATPDITEKLFGMNPEWDVYEAMATLVDYLPEKNKIKLLDRIGSLPAPPANALVASAVVHSLRRHLPNTQDDSQYTYYHDKIWLRLKDVKDNWQQTPPAANGGAARLPANNGAPGAAPNNGGAATPPNIPARTNPNDPVGDFFRRIFGG